MKRGRVRPLTVLAGVCVGLWLLLAPGLASLLVSGELGGVVRYLVQGAAEGYGLHNLGHVVMAFAISWKYVWPDLAAAVLTMLFWAAGAAAAWGLRRAGRRPDENTTRGEIN